MQFGKHLQQVLARKPQVLHVLNDIITVRRQNKGARRLEKELRKSSKLVRKRQKRWTDIHFRAASKVYFSSVLVRWTLPHHKPESWAGPLSRTLVALPP